MKTSKQLQDERITPTLLREKGVRHVLDKIRNAKGYYITNADRDLSQSDFRNRIMPHTQMIAAPYRNDAGYFSIEISGGASVHVDMLRKQINPIEKLMILSKEMPDTLFQTVCRGINLFGYRPYPENVIRLTVQHFAKYVHVWRVFDFLNYIPNMIPVYEEVLSNGCILEAAVCFSTGPEHTDEFYVKKVGEILNVTGKDIIICIKNHGGLGSPKKIGDLIKAIIKEFPDIIIHYHGHNTDGNDIGRIVEAVRNGAKIVDAGDHAFTGYFGPPPILTVVDVLNEYGYKAQSINRDAIIETSNKLWPERKYYKDVELHFGFDPTVHIHKLPGGGIGWNYEQAAEGNFLNLMKEILLNELPKVHVELGNWWSAAPGSQILWTTAVNNVLKKARYRDATENLKNLLLGRYGDFPFYKPDDEIYKSVFGPEWKKIVSKESGYQKIEAINLDNERQALEKNIGRPATEEELVLYLQHPNAAVCLFKFEAKYGKTWVLSPSIWFKKGGFNVGDKFEFTDAIGQVHSIEIGPQRKTKTGDILGYFVIDHHQETILTEIEKTWPDLDIERNIFSVDGL